MVGPVERRFSVNRSCIEIAGHTRSSTTLRSPELLIQLVENRGVTFSSDSIDQAFPRLAGPTASLTVVLEGSYSSSGAGTHGAGSAAFEVRERWEEHWRGERQRMLTIAWAPNGPTRANGSSLGPVALAEWDALARSLGRAELDDRTIDSIGASARRFCAAEGIELPEAETPVPSAVLSMEGALSWAHCNLDRSPQWVDLVSHTRLPERTLRRTFGRHGAWLPSGSFRESVYLARLKGAVSFLGVAGLGANRVAQALGYASDRALYTALRRAGIPIPR